MTDVFNREKQNTQTGQVDRSRDEISSLQLELEEAKDSIKNLQDQQKRYF